MVDHGTLAAEIEILRASHRATAARIAVLELRMKVAEEEIANERRRDEELAARLNEIEKQLGEP